MAVCFDSNELGQGDFNCQHQKIIEIKKNSEKIFLRKQQFKSHYLEHVISFKGVRTQHFVVICLNSFSKLGRDYHILCLVCVRLCISLVKLHWFSELELCSDPALVKAKL